MWWGGAMLIGIHFLLWGRDDRPGSGYHNLSHCITLSRQTINSSSTCIAHPAHLFDRNYCSKKVPGYP